ncbi:Palmitoyltransferase ZDHHC15 [Termitomyces sp. J132]|nr:Palmitoyltransferase ZDHHC15 [Termitomyces sp. J132]
MLHSPLFFAIHLCVTYTLTFLAFSSLIVCVARDPGPVAGTQQSEDEETSLREALMPDVELNVPGRWCRKCWAPKPERTHHCSACGRCVLKMDHHCPWLGNNCIGHRTYPAFLHFLLSVTLLALYIAIISIFALIYAFNDPYVMVRHSLTIARQPVEIGQDVNTPIHELFLAALGVIFSMVIGPFLGYHVYLVSTNQTTLETISPFLLLKHLPKLPFEGHDLSDPPLESELSAPQRRLVKDAYQAIHLYDIGWRGNWAQVLGCEQFSGWVIRLWCGGASPGDGKYFPRNPNAESVLARLATELVKIDRQGHQ